MSGETLSQAPRRFVSKTRVHDYLYDSAYIVSGARDYARSAFKAAMASAQVIVRPAYRTMFSEIRKYPSMHMVYYPNCRLPQHIDRSYKAYQENMKSIKSVPVAEMAGKYRFKYSAVPKKLAVSNTSPDFHPPSPSYKSVEPGKPMNIGTQSVFRESSAQTIPWQPDGRPSEQCEDTPEVLYLDKLEWGPGSPYRTGDLPADFHTTEIINKMRHARKWMDLVEKGRFPKGMKKTNAIISDVETKDWIFREAEIDELQEIRLELLHKIKEREQTKKANKSSKKLAKLWAYKKEQMENKVDRIRRSRDREVRKLTALHQGGGRQGAVARLRAARGSGPVTLAAFNPTSNVHAPLSRNGYQARGRHAEILYDPGLLTYEDHEQLSQPPSWVASCGQNLKKSCSGHQLRPDKRQLCERETKWSEEFLENLHMDLRKARLGAVAKSAGPLHVLKPRFVAETPRPATPVVDAVGDDEEVCHQSALLMQRILKGRAVQILMYEGRTRAAELTEELKTTHGLQREDKIRIAKEEAKSREYNAVKTEEDKKEDAISALVEELCGGAVSAALDFLEKELRRLREERRQHAFILIALREKTLREAAEAGRRQKEEQRRKEHDEMFKQIIGVTHETIDMYLEEIVTQGVELAAEADAVSRAIREADRVDKELKENEAMSTAEQNELVAELVQQFLLPEAHKQAARHHISSIQNSKLEAARQEIFRLLDDAEIKTSICTQCGVPLGETCRCKVCPVSLEPVETEYRDDSRWKHARTRPVPPKKTPSEKFPPYSDFRGMLNVLLDEAVQESRDHKREIEDVTREYGHALRGSTEAALEAVDTVHQIIDIVIGAATLPEKVKDYHHFMVKMVGDAMARSEPFKKRPCPEELPSELRRQAEEMLPKDTACLCEEQAPVKTKVKIVTSPEATTSKLPSELRQLEAMKKCKCDNHPSPTLLENDDSETDDGTEVDTDFSTVNDEDP